MIYAITPHELATLDLLAVAAAGLADQQDSLADLIIHTLRVDHEELAQQEIIDAYIRSGARSSIETLLDSLRVTVDF
ncbi:MAG: hypothetical protein IT425_10600 [Pirellulales bacterium]|nr:hypothetical protein [Pirellulales bacterium]